MPLPTQGPYGTPVLDDFNRAGTTSPPSTSWTTGFNTTSGALALAGDTATVKANVAGFCDSYWNLVNFGPDSEAWIVNTVLATGTDELFAIYLRGTPGASATAYEISINAGTLTTVTVQRENSPSTFPTLGTHTLPASFAVNDGLAVVVFEASFPLIETWWWDDSAGGGWQCVGRIRDNFSVTAPASRTPFFGAGRIALELQNTTSRVTLVGGGTISLPPTHTYLPPFVRVPGGPRFLPPPPAQPAAPSGTTFLQSLAGSITPTGAISFLVFKALSGAITASGALSKLVSKPLAGATSPTGLLSNLTLKGLAGSISPTGTLALVKVVLKNFAGSITPTGTLSKLTLKSLAGSVSPTGALSRLTLKGLAGAITPTGLLSRLTFKGLSGSVSPTGTLSRAIVRLISLAGSITPTGALSRSTLKSAGGSITPSGSVSRVVSKGLAGAIAPVGVAAKFVQRKFAGAVTPTGTLQAILGSAIVFITGFFDRSTARVDETSSPTATGLDSSGAAESGKSSPSAQGFDPPNPHL